MVEPSKVERMIKQYLAFHLSNNPNELVQYAPGQFRNARIMYDKVGRSWIEFEILYAGREVSFRMDHPAFAECALRASVGQTFHVDFNGKSGFYLETSGRPLGEAGKHQSDVKVARVLALVAPHLAAMPYNGASTTDLRYISIDVNAGRTKDVAGRDECDRETVRMFDALKAKYPALAEWDMQSLLDMSKAAIVERYGQFIDPFASRNANDNEPARWAYIC